VRESLREDRLAQAFDKNPDVQMVHGLLARH
jgi:hypothetical protein